MNTNDFDYNFVGIVLFIAGIIFLGFMLFTYWNISENGATSIKDLSQLIFTGISGSNLFIAGLILRKNE